MLIVMKTDATDTQIKGVLAVIEGLGFKGHPMPGATRTAIGITGNQGAVDPSHFENLPGVADAIRVSKPYKLITLDIRPEKTVVRVGDATIGGDELAIIAGPCAIESRAQAFAVAEAVRRSGARFFRGGAFKPRTSPYAFQGLGEEGLKILAEVRDGYGLKIVTEALDEASVDLVERYGDMIQIGVRTFAQHTRNTLDLASIPAVRRISHLPVIVDPSHGTGKNYMVIPLACAGVAVGADGLIVEVHDQPEKALSDGAQALTLEQYDQLIQEVRPIHEVVAPQPVG